MTRNGITVTYLRSNAAYDIYEVMGVMNVEENEDPHYHEELRNNGVTEEMVLSQFAD